MVPVAGDARDEWGGAVTKGIYFTGSQEMGKLEALEFCPMHEFLQKESLPTSEFYN